MSAVVIAIIGSGSTGLTAAKSCLEEGLDIVVFEKMDCISGLWKYRDETTEGIASCMRSTVLNTSKEMSAFSDFPPPQHFPNYMHNTKMDEYLSLYAKNFGLEKYIKFRHEVLNCQQNDDYDETGKWKLEVKDLESEQTSHHVFHAVMVCIGHNNLPKVPIFKDQHKFKGDIIQAHSYKKSNGFEDKKIVVVGIGNSGGDISVELSTVAQQVYLSTRRGTWISTRLGRNGLPLDTLFLRRSLNTMFRIIPFQILNNIAEFYINTRFNHELYQLKPKNRIFSQIVMINDDLPNRILTGSVIVKSNIECFTENGVIFEGETDETSCDTVVLATGYHALYPFLSESLQPFHENNLKLYKYMFNPELKHPKTLAILSLIVPGGPVFPIIEMQSRWFALLMKNKLKLPNSEKMAKDVGKKLTYAKNRFYDNDKQLLIDWIPFMDELANIIGVKPLLWKYFFTDPKLWYNLYFGPSVPYQYRLKGPNKWLKARETILGVNDRIHNAFKTKSSENSYKF